VILIIQLIAIGGTLCGIVYHLFSLWSARQFLVRRVAVSGQFTPPVSILKPLRGVDPNAYESLRSHCIQDYPDFEIIFGVCNPDDLIVRVIERLSKEFPDVSIRLVVCSKVFGMNFKVSNLLQMLPTARHRHILINDSDICVGPDYLQRVMALLEDQSVGMITCLYRGVPANSLGSKFESLGISSDFTPGVLTAKYLEGGIRFAMGSTIAFHRRTLDVIGGLETITDYLADDFELGQRTSNAGFRVELADCIVDHYLPAYSFAGFLQHQLRWARGIRSSRPGGYAGLVFTFAIPWSVFGLIASNYANWGWSLVIVALMLRYAVALVFGVLVLKDRQILRYFWLIPVRDFVGLVIWVWCYAGRRVVWRGQKFELAQGKLRMVT
jgi:ceramide glucosyltransferase